MFLTLTIISNASDPKARLKLRGSEQTFAFEALCYLYLCVQIRIGSSCTCHFFLLGKYIYILPSSAKNEFVVNRRASTPRAMLLREKKTTRNVCTKFDAELVHKPRSSHALCTISDHNMYILVYSNNSISAIAMVEPTTPTPHNNNNNNHNNNHRDTIPLPHPSSKAMAAPKPIHLSIVVVLFASFCFYFVKSSSDQYEGVQRRDEPPSYNKSLLLRGFLDGRSICCDGARVCMCVCVSVVLPLEHDKSVAPDDSVSNARANNTTHTR